MVWFEEETRTFLRNGLIVSYLRNPGSLTTEIVNGARVVNRNARKYLTELEREGKVRKSVGGTPRKPSSMWYPVENAPSSQ
jgi:DeoR/GlpR family transcriptional regulator of sugar metabolism